MARGLSRSNDVLLDPARIVILVRNRETAGLGPQVSYLTANAIYGPA